MTIIRIWTNLGWMHEVHCDGLVLATSKHRDELREQFPQAQENGLVLCGETYYQENRD